MPPLPKTALLLLAIPAFLLALALAGLLSGPGSGPLLDEPEAEDAGAVLAEENGALCEAQGGRTAPEGPNDPLFERQRSLRATGVPGAWAVVGSGEGVKVAVIDSGVDVAHGDLAGKVVAARDFSGLGPATQDPTGHGTAVAGILAASSDDGEGIAGVCPGCDLVVARVDAYGAAGDDGALQLARAIRWSQRRGAEVINVSLGTSAPSPRLARAVERVSEDGALVVAAAGDPGSGSPLYPAAYPQTLSVSAGDAEGVRSNPGDVSAPAGGVISTLPGGGHGAFSGTSAAAPQVSGAAALLVGGGLSPAQARERLLSTARNGGGTPALDATAAAKNGEEGCEGDDGAAPNGR